MYQRMLVPLDDSSTAQRGFEEAIALAKALRSTIVLLHVVEFVPVMVEMATSTTWEAISDGLRGVGRGILEAAHRKATEAGVSSEAVLEDMATARVADMIVEQAGRQRCELIVMGTHGRRGVGHALIGSDAERVARIAPVPVLLVRQSERA